MNVNHRGLSLLDVIIILVVLAVLILASVQEFPTFEDQALSPPPAPTPSITAQPAS